MSKPEVDLTLLKRLVAELDAQITTVKALRANSKPDKVELNVEGSKAIGLASGIMQEAALLVMDIQYLASGQAPQNKNELLDKIMQGLGGKSGSN